MERRREVSAFLESGPWVPLEVATPLTQCLLRLDARLNTPDSVNPTLGWLVHLKVRKLEQMLEAGFRHHQLVPADQWQQMAYHLQVLTRLVTATQ